MSTQQISVLLSRIALFVVYFWFGILKVIGQSPASQMVESLFDKTISGIMPFSSFIVLFGLFEIAVGILFFIPKLEKIAVTVFALHMITTILPLFIMSEVWTNPLVPTLEGQYIIKNLALIACALTIWANKDVPKQRASDTILNTI